MEEERNDAPGGIILITIGIILVINVIIKREIIDILIVEIIGIIIILLTITLEKETLLIRGLSSIPHKKVKIHCLNKKYYF
jgi:hypothetical protein